MTANPISDPEFYCHGQRCLNAGCSPLFCADQSPDKQRFWFNFDRNMPSPAEGDDE